MDRISNLPDSLISLILGRLPFSERVKTSALSRSWRFRWTFLPSLPFDSRFYCSVRGNKKRSQWNYAKLIDSLLLQHGNCIQQFSLYIPKDCLPNFSEFEHAIRFVTRSRSIEKLSLTASTYCWGSILALPYSIFSAVNLKHLLIIFLPFNPPSWFEGFPNLTHLGLMSTFTAADTVSHFISVCPRLEEVNLHLSRYDVEGLLYRASARPVLEFEAPALRCLRVSANLKDITVSNFPNLVSVYISMLKEYPDEESAFSVDMFKNFNSLAQVQQLILNKNFCKFLGRCSVIHMLSRFDRMKKLEFSSVNFLDADELRCALSIFAASPNIRELKLSVENPSHVDAGSHNFEWLVEKHIKGEFRHLVRVELTSVLGTKIQMKTIERLLCFSPVLEVMYVQFAHSMSWDANVRFLKAMLNSPRASSKVKFEFPDEQT